MAKIAILTNFTEINHGYSLTGIVEDQIEMLSRYGHEVHFFVERGFRRETLTEGFKRAKLRDVIPKTDLVDYGSLGEMSKEHEKYCWDLKNILKRYVMDFDLAISHDWVFTGWNLVYAEAVRLLRVMAVPAKWLHWIHSIPSGRRDWWDINRYGPGHRIVYPNRTDLLRVRESFGAEDPGRVMAIPHIKDPRTWFGFDEFTNGLIDRVPGLMSADVVQILPASTDRLKFKGVGDVIEIFGGIKRAGRSVCLFIANQWATGRGRVEDITKYLKLAEERGLEPGREVVFSSELDSDYQAGLPKRVIRELFMLSNLFIFPTHHESFGLVVPEAALSGVYFVGNRNLVQQLEVAGGADVGLWLPFGSYESVSYLRPQDRLKWLKSEAQVVLRDMDNNPAVRFKTHARQTLNRDVIYHKYYAPILAEAEMGRGAA